MCVCVSVYMFMDLCMYLRKCISVISVYVSMYVGMLCVCDLCMNDCLCLWMYACVYLNKFKYTNINLCRYVCMCVSIFIVPLQTSNRIVLCNFVSDSFEKLPSTWCYLSIIFLVGLLLRCLSLRSIYSKEYF